MVSSHKLDLIHNALLIGMSLDDAYIFASCTEEEIIEIKENDRLQAEYQSMLRAFEYQLLEKLGKVIDKQVNMGRENALTWMLEKTNPRYTNKPTLTLPEIKLNVVREDPAKVDTVDIHRYEDTDDSDQ